MDDKNKHSPTLKNRNLAMVAVILGVVAMLLSGTCTFFFAGDDLINHSGAPYYNYWSALIIGAMFFIPALLLFLLGRYVRKRGAGVWFTILMGIILASAALFVLNFFIGLGFGR